MTSFLSRIWLRRESISRSIGDLPNAVVNAVLIGYFDCGAAGRAGKQRVDSAGIFIKHEQQFKVGAGSAKQVEAVCLGFGQGLLMAIYDFRRVVFDASERDEA